jgi:hypothetical protein
MELWKLESAHFLALLPNPWPEGRLRYPGRSAVRFESALAVMYWWGVSCKTIAWWRRALGVERMENDGSRRLILAGIEAKAAKARGRPLPPEQVERRRQTALALDLGRNLIRCPNGRPWTAEELAALGTAPDAELAQRFGRIEAAIRVRRDKVGIDRAPGDNERRPWEAWEDALVLKLPVKDAAAQTGRTRTAVYQRRMALKSANGSQLLGR